MKKECQKCGKLFDVKPSKFETRKYCSRACASKLKTCSCGVCGKEVTRPQSQILNEVFCSMDCATIAKSERFTKMNIELNPDRMTPEVKAKLRDKGLQRGEGKGYEKTYGVHTHRIVAADKLGRPLLKGEVVHHNDEIKRNNDPDNLTVFATQSEHARHHKLNK